MENKNIWIQLIILAIGVLVGWLIWGNSTNGLTNNLTTGNLDQSKIEKTINEKLIQGGAKAKVESVKSLGNISEVKLSVNGQKDSLFVNNNGRVFYQKLVDLDELEKQQKAAAEAAKVKNKSDKPKVELFVMSYCPFGTQTEKGFLPAIKKLGNKIDAKVKFVNYSMHPCRGEVKENLLQYCIEKEQPEKYNSYLACFLDKADSYGCLKKNNISKDSLKTCIETTDKKFSITKNLKNKSSWLNGHYPKFLINDDLNKKYGVQGSPTLVINGQKMERVGRDSNSIFKAICSAFKNLPTECKEELDKTTPKPGFGYDGAGSANSTEAGCGA